jgi:hypothetical protein
LVSGTEDLGSTPSGSAIMNIYATLYWPISYIFRFLWKDLKI